MKKMKVKSLLTVVIACLFALPGQAQSLRNNHVYFHAGLGAGHVYTAAIPSILFWGLNSLTGTDTFENAMEYTSFSGEMGGIDIKTRPYDALGYRARDLFANLRPYVKLGYQTMYMSNLNWGVYGSAEYIHNQFDSRLDGGISDYEMNIIDRMQLGGTFFLVLGGVEKKYKLMLEGGLRYSQPLKYEGPLALGKEDLNSGLVSHYAFTVKGSNAVQNFGIFADINHFNMLKTGAKLNKIYTIGLMWSITPGQAKSSQLNF